MHALQPGEVPGLQELQVLQALREERRYVLGLQIGAFVRKAPHFLQVGMGAAGIAAMVAGCAGTMNVVRKPGTTFSRQSTITVVSPAEDPLNVQPQLEHQLVARGFEVVSEAVARNRLKFDAEVKEGPGSTSVESSTERVKEVRSAYILRFAYTTRLDFPHGRVIKQFTASVVDLATGRLEATVDFSQGDLGSKSIGTLMREVGQTLFR